MKKDKFVLSLKGGAIGNGPYKILHKRKDVPFSIILLVQTLEFG